MRNRRHAAHHKARRAALAATRGGHRVGSACCGRCGQNTRRGSDAAAARGRPGDGRLADQGGTELITHGCREGAGGRRFCRHGRGRDQHRGRGRRYIHRHRAARRGTTRIGRCDLKLIAAYGTEHRRIGTAVHHRNSRQIDRRRGRAHQRPDIDDRTPCRGRRRGGQRHRGASHRIGRGRGNGGEGGRATHANVGGGVEAAPRGGDRMRPASGGAAGEYTGGTDAAAGIGIRRPGPGRLSSHGEAELILEGRREIGRATERHPGRGRSNGDRRRRLGHGHRHATGDAQIAGVPDGAQKGIIPRLGEGCGTDLSRIGAIGAESHRSRRRSRRCPEIGEVGLAAAIRAQRAERRGCACHRIRRRRCRHGHGWGSVCQGQSIFARQIIIHQRFVTRRQGSRIDDDLGNIALPTAMIGAILANLVRLHIARRHQR